MNTLFEAELEIARRNHINKLVQSGVWTQEQADVALRPRNQQQEQKSIGELTSQIPDETPSYQERAAAMNRSVDERYRSTYGAKSPSLRDTLTDFSQAPDSSPAERTNFAATVPKVTAEHEASWRSLSQQGQQNVITEISKNHPIDSALYGGFNWMLFVIPTILLILSIAVISRFWNSHLKTSINTTLTNALGASLVTLGCLYQIGAIVAPIIGIIFLAALIRSC